MIQSRISYVPHNCAHPPGLSLLWSVALAWSFMLHVCGDFIIFISPISVFNLGLPAVWQLVSFRSTENQRENYRLTSSCKSQANSKTCLCVIISELSWFHSILYFPVCRYSSRLRVTCVKVTENGKNIDLHIKDGEASFHTFFYSCR